MSLADQLDISYQAVSNWERGESMPDISKLPQLAHIFDVRIDDILDESKRAESYNPALFTESQKIFSEGYGGAAELLAISSFLSKPTIDACAKEIIEREGKGVIVFLTSVMSENAIDE
ncbi:helix-turn-helix transcriptional regulator [Paenibacillus glycanilyticus]|uniref:helix-turn-helix transcriptional regulator n=1 Tax=Paenibacillus glycanilyticus TaxID=126569 RepID=UPI00203D64E5|nr:helix-turn-helix transcriptional regulator [Paenibacillus glycanilyticus]MCM3629479.1 helix-turn-helix transcriptional regulator [Paenibacillus glycanilyticus]